MREHASRWAGSSSWTKRAKDLSAATRALQVAGEHPRVAESHSVNAATLAGVMSSTSTCSGLTPSASQSQRSSSENESR